MSPHRRYARAIAGSLIASTLLLSTARADETEQHTEAPAALPSWKLTWGGYLHIAWRWVQQPTDYQLAGNNNGFQLEQARLGANVLYKDSLAARISVEVASEDRLDKSFPAGTLTARLRDAYLTWAPLRALRLSAGQMVTPFDLDSMRSDAYLPFVSRAVPVEGVQPSEGRTLDGIGTDRSLGLALHSGDIGLGDVASLRFQLMVANNNGQNRSLNSNNTPALFGRLEFALWGSGGLPEDRIGPMRARTDEERLPLIGLGVAGRYNPVTTGTPPDLIAETLFGVAADLIVAWQGIDAEAGLLYTTRRHDTLSALANLEQLGWWAHLRYSIPRLPVVLTPGYRIASFAPWAHLSSSAASPTDAMLHDDLSLLYHTIGLTIRPTPTFPMHLAVNYTITSERGDHVLSNDRFEADVAVVF